MCCCGCIPYSCLCLFLPTHLICLAWIHSSRLSPLLLHFLFSLHSTHEGMWGTYYGKVQATLRCVCIGDMHSTSVPGGDTEECAHWVVISTSALVLMATKGSRLILTETCRTLRVLATYFRLKVTGFSKLYVMKTTTAVKWFSLTYDEHTVCPI